METDEAIAAAEVQTEDSRLSRVTSGQLSSSQTKSRASVSEGTPLLADQHDLPTDPYSWPGTSEMERLPWRKRPSVSVPCPPLLKQVAQ